jgi:hypothetical protein
MHFVGKTKEQRTFGEPNRGWENVVKMDRKYGGMVWIGVMWLRIRTDGGLL